MATPGPAAPHSGPPMPIQAVHSPRHSCLLTSPSSMSGGHRRHPPPPLLTVRLAGLHVQRSAAGALAVHSHSRALI
ncbi:hypothetical protein PtB15_12B105 [Puccinia triticina]|nr:hypothetical protein PtB15_12B105 [Puccinia triticina]